MDGRRLAKWHAGQDNAAAAPAGPGCAAALRETPAGDLPAGGGASVEHYQVVVQQTAIAAPGCAVAAVHAATAAQAPGSPAAGASGVAAAAAASAAHVAGMSPRDVSEAAVGQAVFGAPGRSASSASSSLVLGADTTASIDTAVRLLTDPALPTRNRFAVLAACEDESELESDVLPAHDPVVTIGACQHAAADAPGRGALGGAPEAEAGESADPGAYEQRYHEAVIFDRRIRFRAAIDLVDDLLEDSHSSIAALSEAIAALGAVLEEHRADPGNHSAYLYLIEGIDMALAGGDLGLLLHLEEQVADAIALRRLRVLA